MAVLGIVELRTRLAFESVRLNLDCYVDAVFFVNSFEIGKQLSINCNGELNACCKFVFGSL